METGFERPITTPHHVAAPEEDLGLDGLLLLAVAAAAVLAGFVMVLLAAMARVRA